MSAYVHLAAATYTFIHRNTVSQRKVTALVVDSRFCASIGAEVYSGSSMLADSKCQYVRGLYKNFTSPHQAVSCVSSLRCDGKRTTNGGTSPLRIFASYFDTQRCNASPSTLLRNEDTIRRNATGVYTASVNLVAVPPSQEQTK
ncbi:hypothetical protein E2C01_012444 [Portunus trituberculatus]|uniref:Uncharacterized protein n=1 Tax=Portunus trituberculatus TaxID=210409 RepID=A0A5B7DE71_PORTR|nr:hypothetical protein [Portunus trituberculatus]